MEERTNWGSGHIARSRQPVEENLRTMPAERAAMAEKARIHEFQERFLGILGHDLCNPLATIDMAAGLLRKHVKAPEMVRVVERIQKSALRMSRMIEQIFDLTRSQLDGGLEVTPAAMDLSGMLTTIVDELKGAHPSRTVELRCPSLVGRWDRDRLEQVFCNLVDNAIVHSDPAEPVRVDARVEDDNVVVEVHNKGTPIPADTQSTLFDSFRRGVGESRTAKTWGLGLGLYISHELIRAHGGSIQFNSTADGTTFRVRMPRQIATES